MVAEIGDHGRHLNIDGPFGDQTRNTVRTSDLGIVQTADRHGVFDCDDAEAGGHILADHVHLGVGRRGLPHQWIAAAQHVDRQGAPDQAGDAQRDSNCRAPPAARAVMGLDNDNSRCVHVFPSLQF